MVRVQLNAIQNGDRITVLPLGEIKGRDGRYWDLTSEDAAALVNRLHADGVDIVIDYEHGTYSGNGRAAGWLRDFRADPEGVTARVEFTASALEQIRANEYRYLSPAFAAEGSRILALESVGLVNSPNLAALPALNQKEKDMDEKDKAELKVAQEAVAAVKTELNAARSEYEGKLSAQAEKHKSEVGKLLIEVNTLKAEIAKRDADVATREITALVDTAIAEGKLAPGQKDSAVKLGLNSHADLEAFIRASPLSLNGLKAKQGEGRSGQEPPSGSLDETELAMCRMLGVKPEDFQKNKKEAI